MDLSFFWSGAPEYWHFLLAVYFAFDFVAARSILNRRIFIKLAIRFMGLGPALRATRHDRRVPMTKFNARKALHKRIEKCIESLWKLTYYTIVETCLLAITYNEPWFRDTREYFKGWPNQELKFSLSLYYMFQCGFYLYSIVALLLWETRRKDFPVMMSHHIITVILIGCSYITGFFRIGSIILALHDASDIFMEAAKIFKYSKKELGASIFFGLFALSWLVLRLIFFPFWVIKASAYDLLRHFDASNGYEKMLYYVFNTMLLTLLVFHIYWWYLICAMIVRQLRNKGQVGEDIRSDSEDDD